MTNNIQPLSKRVLISRTEKEELLKGIIIPDSSKKKKFEITVVQVSDDITKVKVGDKIMISGYGSQEIVIEDETYFLVKEDDIVAIIHD